MNRVLIISYYFPPMGMGGVQRTLKFAKYLTRFNWQPVVLTINPRKYYAIDEHLLDEALSNGVIIERTGKKDMNISNIVTRVPKERFRKLRSIISQFFFVPDSKILWKNKALKKIDEIWKKYGGFQIVYATAPPYTDFLIGQEVKRKYKIPLVIDYRDAWVDSPVLNFYPTPIHKSMNITRERRVVKDANIILTTNRRVKEFIIRRYGNIGYNDVKIFPHGYDSEDFEFAQTKKLPLTNKMRITYSGSFYTRNPKFYFEAIKMLIERHPEIRSRVEFLFLGIFTKDHLNYAKKLNILDVLVTSTITNARNTYSLQTCCSFSLAEARTKTRPCREKSGNTSAAEKTYSPVFRKALRKNFFRITTQLNSCLTRTRRT
ncbi:MAG: hypothetical protein LWX07_10090 [Bacteroidetes bacterium]|nr:hypothetical protein [Bacteroidota bacterium]